MTGGSNLRARKGCVSIQKSNGRLIGKLPPPGGDPTEPEAGSDSAAVQTTARFDGDEWVLNGEKIYCTAGQRCDAVVVWATMDKNEGKGAIKSFIVSRDTPGMKLVRVEDKMGLRVSDTTAFSLMECRLPHDYILGSPEIARTEEERKKAFGGVMQTFDNTRPRWRPWRLGSPGRHWR